MLSSRSTPVWSLAALLLLSSGPLTLSACGDDSGPGSSDASASEAGVDATSREASVDSVAPADSGDPVDLFRSDAGSCAELSASDCFSNLDCQADRRCQSVDGAGVVVCCLPGPRGEKTAGEPCQSEADCASAVCIAKGSAPSVCSKDCQSEADCPSGMKDCKTIAFSGSPHKWCFPQ